MAILDTQTAVKRGKIRGRESRNQTLTTKVTATEYRAVEDAAGAEAKTTGEWLRDLALEAVAARTEPGAETVVLPEIVGVRLLLVNALRSVAIGQTMTPEAFDKLLDQIGTAKHELAGKIMAEGRR
ncbi:hypothetical protein SAMN05421819_4502 [Bryocella elongata]|uniref:Uncharacterized protein n=1 Tax=Bryocella elongata TaxID=863522 RepID=A0A1H6CFZ8_9BACT|nr:hypothetical protein [Bryocella elongata]MBW4028047.1 hypothetical protein [Acidobacteriota bacterium]SEG71585.1 hypothetical protein SAMN05421819_4502 [Bryocella elongata]